MINNDPTRYPIPTTEEEVAQAEALLDESSVILPKKLQKPPDASTTRYRYDHLLPLGYQGRSYHVSPMRVAGVSYQQDEIGHCKVGNYVRLEPGLENPHDQHAVKVEVNIGGTGNPQYVRVGFIPQDCTLAVKEAIRREDYRGAVIILLGKRAGVNIIGIRLALLFEKDPPDLYSRSREFSLPPKS